MSMKFDISGFAELERNLKALGPDVGTKAGQKATAKAARHAARAVRAAAPVGDDDTSRSYGSAAGSVTADYGHLKHNIRVQKKRKKGVNVVGSMIGTSRAFWGYFLEFGTRKMVARPWFGPAMKAALPGALEIMKSELRKALRDAAQGSSRR